MFSYGKSVTSKCRILKILLEFSGRNLTAVLKLFNIESSLKFPNIQCFNTRTTVISNYD